MEIIKDRTLRQKFTQQYEQLVADRDRIRNEILEQVSDKTLNVFMPVNLPRLITNCIRTNNIKQG